MKSVLSRKFLLIMVFSLSITALFFYSRGDFSNSLPGEDIVVGQNFIVGISGPVLNDANIQFLEAVKPGGIVLYKYNITSEDGTKEFVSKLQEVALRTTGMPYIIMLDEEPGGAKRLDPFKGAFRKGKVDWEIIEKGVKKLREIGIDVVLAPLADYPFLSGSAVNFRLPVIGLEELKKFNEKFISLLAQNRVSATLKHFPGLGLIAEDTHTALLHSKAPFSLIEESIDVFKSGTLAGAEFVMTNHGIYKAIDPAKSASLSPKTIKLLREKVGFKGIIITDDIANMPLGDPGQVKVHDAAVAVFRAGHNMVLLGSKRSVTRKTYEFVLETYRQDRKLKKVLDANYQKIIRYKKSR